MTKNIDVLIIGAGAAGSAAAMQLGRVRRSVVVADTGKPRNAPAPHMQGYLGHDGRSPKDFLRIAHAEFEAYGVTRRETAIVSVTDAAGRMECATSEGEIYSARRVLLASGLTDKLPPIEGVSEHWGGRVIHCPWCHGWEVQDQDIAVLDTTGIGVHQALVFGQLSEGVTLVRNHQLVLTDEEVERLHNGGVTIERRPATAVVDNQDKLTIVLAGGALTVDVAVVAPRFTPNTSMVDGLIEVADHISGLGQHVVVDEKNMTSHPKVFAAGNVTDPMQQVLHAAAHGSKVATTLNASLLDEDIGQLRPRR